MVLFLSSVSSDGVHGPGVKISGFQLSFGIVSVTTCIFFSASSCFWNECFRAFPCLKYV